MDRPENRRTITIKLNGNARPFQENESLKKNTAGQQEEKLNRKQDNENLHDAETAEAFSVKETAAAGETVDESFDWILPDAPGEAEIKEFKQMDTAKKPDRKHTGFLMKNNGKKGKSPFAPIFFAVFFAVLLGTSFGFIVLKLVIPDRSANEKVEAGPVTAAIEKDSAQKKPAAASSLSLPPISTYVVQQGVYTSKESAQGEQAAVTKKGFPVQIVEINGKFVPLLGVAGSLKDAKQMEKQFKSNGINAWGKAATFGGTKANGLSIKEKNFLDAAPPLYEALAAAGAEAMLTEKIPSEMLTSIEENRSMLKEIKDRDIQNKQVKSMKADLEQAVETASTYQKSAKPDVLAELQGNLLSFLSSYHSFQAKKSD